MWQRLITSVRQLTPAQIVGQGLFYLLFCAFVGYLADSPPYRYLAPGQAEVRLAVRHSGKLLGECTELSVEAMGKLAPNMRNPLVCPRERSPVRIELQLDDRIVFASAIAPAGLHHDGISAAYQRFQVPAGPVRVRLRVDDDERVAGFSHELERDLVLTSEQCLVIEFNNGFRVHLPPAPG